MSEYRIVVSDDGNSKIDINIEVVEGKTMDLLTQKFDSKEFYDLTEAEITVCTILVNLIKERNVIDSNF